MCNMNFNSLVRKLALIEVRLHCSRVGKLRLFELAVTVCYYVRILLFYCPLVYCLLPLRGLLTWGILL